MDFNRRRKRRRRRRRRKPWGEINKPKEDKGETES